MSFAALLLPLCRLNIPDLSSQATSTNTAFDHKPFDFATVTSSPRLFFSPVAGAPHPIGLPPVIDPQPAPGTEMDTQTSDGLSTAWPIDVDPFELMMAFASRMPEIEQTSLQDGISPSSDTVASTGKTSAGSLSATRRGKGEGAKNYVKVTWWRPHGQTAIAPGQFGAEAHVPQG